MRRDYNFSLNLLIDAGESPPASAGRKPNGASGFELFVMTTRMSAGDEAPAS
jgi:hypothetical protein